MVEDRKPFGSFLRGTLEQQGISVRALAKAIGIAQSSGENLTDFQVKPNAPRPDPLTLRATAEFLRLDEIELFQRAGFLSPYPRNSNLSAGAEYFGILFDELAEDDRKILWDMLRSIRQSRGIGPANEKMHSLISKAKDLQKEFPQFLTKERFSFLTELGRLISKLTPQLTKKAALEALYLRYKYITENTESSPANENEIAQLVEHPEIIIVLNTLVPRRDIPTALEKFYALSFWAIDNLEATPSLKEEEKSALLALWKTLKGIQQHTEAE